jgi:hypothetical protein
MKLKQWKKEKLRTKTAKKIDASDGTNNEFIPHYHMVHKSWYKETKTKKKKKKK